MASQGVWDGCFYKDPLDLLGDMELEKYVQIYLGLHYLREIISIAADENLLNVKLSFGFCKVLGLS